MAISLIGFGTTSYTGTGTSTYNFSSLTDISGAGGVTLQQNDMVVAYLAHSGTATRTNAQLAPTTTGYSGNPIVASAVTSSDTDVLSTNGFFSFMGATPDTSIVLPGCAAATNSMSVVIFVYRGVSNAVPLAGVTPTTATAINGALPDPPSVTTAASPAGQVVVGVMAQAQATGAALTAPTTTAYDATANYVKGTNNTATTNDSAILVGHKTGLGTSTAFNASAATGGTSAATDASGAISFVLKPAARLTATVAASSTPVATAAQPKTHPLTTTVSSTLVATTTWLMIWLGTVSITVIPAMTIARLLNKVTSVTTTPAASLLRSVGKVASSVSTAVAGLIRAVSKALSLATTSVATPTINHIMPRTLSVTSTSVARIVRVISWLLTTATGGVTSNNFTWSEDLSNAAWTKNNASVTADATTAPDGTVTADKIVEAVGVGAHSVFQNTTQNPGDSISFYVKAAERTRCRIDSGNADIVAIVFDLSGGTIVSIGGSPQRSWRDWFIEAASLTIPGAGSDWYRIGVIARSANSYRFGPAIAATSNYTGDGTSGIYMWGAQWQKSYQGFGAYVKTTSAAITTYTAVATIVRAAAKALTITSTATAALNRAAAKAMTLTSTSVSTIVRTAAKAMTIVSTATASMRRAAAKYLSISSTPSALMQRVAAKIISIGSIPVSMLARFAAKSVAISSDPSPTLSKAINKTISTMVTTTVELIRQAGKSLAVTLTSTAILVRSAPINTSLTISTLLVPAMQRAGNKALSATSTPIAVLRRVFSKIVNAVSGAAASLVHSTPTPAIRKVLVGAMRRVAAVGASFRAVAVTALDRSVGVDQQLRVVAAEPEDRDIDTGSQIR